MGSRVRRNRQLRRPPRIEDRHLVHARNSAVGSAAFFRQVFPSNIVDGVLLQRDAGMAALLIREHPDANAFRWAFVLMLAATLIDATMRGLVIMAQSIPDIAEHRSQANPFGAAGTEEWSLPAVGLAGIATAFLEPDPAIEWDDQRIAAVRQALTTLSLPGA